MHAAEGDAAEQCADIAAKRQARTIAHHDTTDCGCQQRQQWQQWQSRLGGKLARQACGQSRTRIKPKSITEVVSSRTLACSA